MCVFCSRGFPRFLNCSPLFSCLISVVILFYPLSDHICVFVFVNSFLRLPPVVMLCFFSLMFAVGYGSNKGYFLVGLQPSNPSSSQSLLNFYKYFLNWNESISELSNPIKCTAYSHQRLITLNAWLLSSQHDLWNYCKLDFYLRDLSLGIIYPI